MRSPIFLGAEGRRFSQELGLHPQFAVLPLEFAQPGAFGDGQRWFLIGVLLRYLCTQLPRVPSCTCISRATSAIGRDVSITIFTASSLNSGVNFLRRPGRAPTDVAAEDRTAPVLSSVAPMGLEARAGSGGAGPAPVCCAEYSPPSRRGTAAGQAPRV